jgi:hypothetical protein
VKAVDQTPSTGENTMRNSMMLKVPAGLIAAVLAVASSTTAAKAQDAGFAAKMTVPFAFQIASGQHFAPGIYTIRMNGEQSMLIRSNTASGLAMTQLANDGQPATQGKAVFTHYGDRYFLRSVSVPGNSSHLICERSKAERQSQVASNHLSAPVEVATLKAGR